MAAHRRGPRARPRAADRADAGPGRGWRRLSRSRRSCWHRGADPRGGPTRWADGPTGAVLATDIAAQMLALAAEAAAQAGLRNVETRVLDARDLDLEPESFDAAISRLALMLLPERAQALTSIHRALKPGKKFVALVLATPDECPFVAAPMGIAARRAR